MSSVTQEKAERSENGALNIAGEFNYQLDFKEDGQYSLSWPHSNTNQLIGMMITNEMLNNTIAAHKQKKMKLTMVEQNKLYGAQYIVKANIHQLVNAVYFDSKEEKEQEAKAEEKKADQVQADIEKQKTLEKRQSVWWRVAFIQTSKFFYWLGK